MGRSKVATDLRAIVEPESQTDDIFEEVHRVNKQADLEDRTLRLSMEAKAVVKIGEYSRGGKSRAEVQAADHDMGDCEKLTPFGIRLPASGESFLYFSSSKVTADFMADCLESLWTELKKKHHPDVTRLVINADDGPERSDRRAQWLARLVRFSQEHGVEVQMAYYPPCHSKCNPIERVWGMLENHWNGQLLDSVEKTLGLARSMT